LAGYLGKTVAELEATISAEEFTEWAILQSIEPWGGGRLDVLSALQQHASLAPWTKGKINVTDLIPNWGKESKPVANNFAQAAMQLIERARAVANG
jgi:hypothetical protein